MLFLLYLDMSDTQIDNIYYSIWDRNTLEYRSRSVHGGKGINDWVNNDVMDIYGKKPSNESLKNVIGKVVLFYISNRGNNSEKCKIVGAGRIKSHDYNALNVYYDSKHNEYRITLDRVMFFKDHITSDLPCTKYNKTSFINGVSRGENVIMKMCSKKTTDNDTDYKTVCTNVLRYIKANNPAFEKLFYTDDDIEKFEVTTGYLYKELKRSFIKNNIRIGERYDNRGVDTSPDGNFTLYPWEWFRYGEQYQNCTSIINGIETTSPGVYELGYIHGDFTDREITPEDVYPFYVGHSGNVKKRLRQHQKTKNADHRDFHQKKLDEGATLVWRYLFTKSKPEADYVEQQFLHMYNYELNKASNKNESDDTSESDD